MLPTWALGLKITLQKSVICIRWEPGCSRSSAGLLSKEQSPLAIWRERHARFWIQLNTYRHISFKSERWGKERSDPDSNFFKKRTTERNKGRSGDGVLVIYHKSRLKLRVTRASLGKDEPRYLTLSVSDITAGYKGVLRMFQLYIEGKNPLCLEGNFGATYTVSSENTSVPSRGMRLKSGGPSS